jgi:hypothetical protein
MMCVRATGRARRSFEACLGGCGCGRVCVGGGGVAILGVNDMLFSMFLHGLAA